MIKHDQSHMFPEGADLPLFSGTVQEGKVEVFEPEPVPQSERLFKCSVCMDTGRVVVKTGHWFIRKYYPCWCEAGQRIKTKSKQEERTGRDA